MDLAAQGTTGLLQVVQPDGTPRGGERALEGLSCTLEEVYELMRITRGLDEELVHLQRQGQLALYPSCHGQEAAQIGCATALRPTDWLFPQYRELGAFLARGIDPAGVGLAWRGTWHGGLGFLERCVAPMSIPIGTQSLHAVGAAMAASWLGDGGVTVGFIGDGATSEGDVHEAMNLAAVQQAPCIFLVQNNGWAISTPTSDQYRTATLAERGPAYGMPGVRVDGNDVVACHLIVAEAAARARAGEGPTLIEAVTYRMGPHTTSDDPTRYRTDEEVHGWQERDPIVRVERLLAHLGRWDDGVEAAAAEATQAARTRLRDAVVDAPDPDVLEVFSHVFAEATPDLLAQRDELARELGRDR